MNVRFMTVGEGEDLNRTIQDHARLSREDYFYYNKRMITMPFPAKLIDASDDAWDDETSVACLETYSKRKQSDRSAGWWLWDKQRLETESRM